MGFKYVSLFCGIGGFDQPLNELGGECVMASEIDPYASKGYELLYGEKPTGDITKVEAKDVPDHDLLVGGFPCLKGEEKVFTTRGLVEIKDIELGDKVLTHKGNYKEVVRRTVNPFEGDYHTFKTQYHAEKWGCTYNHKILGVKVDESCWRNPAGNCIKTCTQQDKVKREKSRDGTKVYEWVSKCEKPYTKYKKEWLMAQDLQEGDYVAVPINQKEDGLTYICDEYKDLPLESELFWEVVGLWVADGSLYNLGRGRHNNIRWSINNQRQDIKEKIEKVVELLGEKPTYYDGEGSVTVSVISKGLTSFLSEYYNDFNEKQLPLYCESLPDNLKTSLLRGYWYGDGHYSDNGKVNTFNYTSTSLPLLNQVQRMMYKYEIVTSLVKLYGEGKREIQGREINAKAAYVLKISGENAEKFNRVLGEVVKLKEYKTKKNTASWFDNDYYYVQIKEKEVKKEKFDVYNLTVEDDHSYGTVGLGIYKNCQAFSISGKRQGFNEARGTLFFDVARIAREKQPKVIFLENVKGLVNHDGGKTIRVIMDVLNDIGYRVDFEVMVSKYFGVPQNRERIFIIAVREDLVENRGWVIRGSRVAPTAKRKLYEKRGMKTFNFNFPKGKETELVIRDVLEDDVDFKYFIKRESAFKFVEKLRKEGKLGSNNKLKKAGVTEIRPRRRGLFNKPIKEDDGIHVLGKLDPAGFDSSNRVYGAGGLSPTITTGGECLILDDDPSIKVLGRMNKGMSGLVYDVEGLSPTLTTGGECHIFDESEKGENTEGMYVRKLTPRECLRLQAFPEQTYDILSENGISDTQIYKQAGNAVTLSVIKAIAQEIIDGGYLK